MAQALDSTVRRIQPVGARVPPHNLDAEESLLGAMLLSRDAIAAALESCAADDFYKPAHGHIFGAITALYARGEPADPVTVADELSRASLLEAVGDASVLISLQVNTPSTANASHYARIVEEHSLLRRLVVVAGEIAELGYSVPEDVSAVVDRAESMVFEVAQRRVIDTMAPLRDLLAASLDHIESLFARGDTITGVPTGYGDLDERLAGLQKSNLVVVGARPAMGKTSFALGIAQHAAVHARVPVLLFSLEMSHLELTQRMLCSEAAVDATRMRNGRLLESDWPKISDAIGRLGDAPIYIDDNPNLTVMEIRAKARRLKARDGLGLVVVDYLQLMSGHAKSRAENRQVEVSEISRGLKVLARELDIPVIALSQLSRNLEMRQDKRPVLADLRESGCLTADTRITRADTGEEVSFGSLLLEGARDVPVWSLDDDLQVVAARMRSVFPSGTKPIFELRLASGRRVTASANHPFRTPSGWRAVEDLVPGDALATPGRLPEPSAPRPRPVGEVIRLAELLGAGAIRRATTSFPRSVFALPTDQLALFLRHLWTAAGAVCPDRRRARVRCVFSTVSRPMADDVQSLLVRFAVHSRVTETDTADGRSVYHVSVVDPASQLRFLVDVGVDGAQEPAWCAAVDILTSTGTWVPAAPTAWPSDDDAAGGGSWGASAAAGPAPVPDVETASAAHPAPLALLEHPSTPPAHDTDVFWDHLVAVIAKGEAPVYDATVPGTHNFLANGVVAHNSIEQDADVVLFIYRDEIYNPDSADRGAAEIIIAKHRNGPTGVTQLAFVDRYTRFASIARV